MTHYSTTSPKSKNLFVYDGRGHRIGSVKGNTLYRTIHERHLLVNPPSLAFDLPSLAGAKQAGATLLVVTRADVGIKLSVPLETYYREGVSFNYGYGEQIGLPLTRFQTIEGKPSEKVEQFALPLGI